MAKRSNQSDTSAASAAAETARDPGSTEVPSPTPEIEAAAPVTEPAKKEMPTISGSEIEMAKSEVPVVEMPQPEATAETEAKKSVAVESARANRFALLAASVALAAALGAVGGALGASGILHMSSQAIAAGDDNTAALQAISNLRNELASLRTSVDTAHRDASGQFTKIAERLNRVEHGQAERSGKLAKVMQTIERIEKRADAAPANDITGSVPTPVAAPRRPVISGWSVRWVRRGIALLNSPRLGLIEVERGDVLPPVGRVEQIKKQDGRWVVVTSRGIIISMR